MNASIKCLVPAATEVIASHRVIRCPWRKECILANISNDKDPVEWCAARLPKATCKWLCKEEGYTAISLLVNFDEIPVKKIGDWFGFARDAGKIARAREKLNVLVECQILAVRRGPTKQGENLYRCVSNTHPLVQQCITKLKARRKAVREEREVTRANLKELDQKYEKMGRLRLP